MAVLPVIAAEIFPVQPLKLFRHIHIAVQIDVAVGRMIIVFMEFNELLIGQIRDHGGIPS